MTAVGAPGPDLPGGSFHMVWGVRALLRGRAQVAIRRFGCGLAAALLALGVMSLAPPGAQGAAPPQVQSAEVVVSAAGEITLSWAAVDATPAVQRYRIVMRRKVEHGIGS